VSVFSVLPASRWQGQGREADRRVLWRSCVIAGFSAGRMPAARSTRH